MKQNIGLIVHETTDWIDGKNTGGAYTTRI